MGMRWMIIRFRRPFLSIPNQREERGKSQPRGQSMAFRRFQPRFILHRGYPARMASSLESGRNAFLQAAKLDFSLSKADADSQRAAIARSFICSSLFNSSNQFLCFYCLSDLISSADTITTPTEEMYAYAARVASLGDDVFGTDGCTIALEAHVAKLLGKEAGLFVFSGTMSNQLALRAHLTQPPYRSVCHSLHVVFVSTNLLRGSVLGDQKAHVWRYEASGASFHSAAQFVPIKPENGRTCTHGRF